jgi:hypothetical protein
LVIAGKLGYGQPRRLTQAEGLAIEVGKMLWSMVEKMGRNSG